MRKTLLLILTMTTLRLSLNAQDTSNSKASYYHSRYNGRKTASGEIYNEQKLTAASNSHKLGTKLLIINKQTGESVTVTVNDRLALYIKDRIDLSKAAFKLIAPLSQGIVKIQVIKNIL